MRILALVAGCETCPRRRYYSGGRYECAETDVVLPPIAELRGGPAEWCPLPPHPAQAFEAMRAELAAIKRAALAGEEKTRASDV